ncbi:orotate phosphoribosyltransferase [bacterium TMED277]|nr:MAG: orotate phosphoribosyltransferase [bacterium TMED277]|tara:strand:- start:351 stop:1016 length:666 start_codon:yes stop_codon:yes gene_type:complete
MKTFSESRLVAKMLLEINAINFNVENPFSLSSGFLSPSYIDCRKIISYPKVRTKITELMIEKIDREIGSEVIKHIIGGETAGIPFASLVAEKLQLPLSYVRKTTKKHGKNKLIEGEIFSQKECLLIEDLMTDGKSKIDFLNKIRDHNIICNYGMVVFNYDIFPGTEKRLKENKIEIHYLACWEDVYNEILEDSAFDTITTKQIKSFIDDPIKWSNERRYEY